MEDVNAVVSLIESLEEGAAADARAEGRGLQGKRVLSVAFREGQRGLLDLAEPRGAVWASVLQSLQEQGAPVYVEIDPRTAMITELLQPKLQPVGDITPLDKGPDLQVQLPDHMPATSCVATIRASRSCCRCCGMRRARRGSSG